MTDIVDELRVTAAETRSYIGHMMPPGFTLQAERAADEIERLRAENAAALTLAKPQCKRWTIKTILGARHGRIIK